MRPITIKMPAELDELLARLARERGVSRATIVREALLAYVATEESSALSVAGDLVGSLDGLPADLSSHPRHMKDFGK